MESVTSPQFRYFVGIDEAGRGPLAGPVSVGAVLAPIRLLLLPYFEKVRDSKKLSPQKRREIFYRLQEESKKGNIVYAHSLVGSCGIDRDGITASIRCAIARTLKKLLETLILLDGGLRAPRVFSFQETIIRGDEKESLIALASIVAKVKRDEKMERLSEQYPQYGFELHKGYGTTLHRKLIKKHNPSPIHRISFLGNILKAKGS
jgi:ribonuclease HII